MTRKQPKIKKKKKMENTRCGCDGNERELCLGSATELGREPTAGILLLHSSAFPLSLFLVKKKKKKQPIFFPSLRKQVQQGNLKLQIPLSLNRDHQLQRTLLKKPPGFYSQSITEGSHNLLRHLTLLKCVWGLGERQQKKATYHC